MLTFLALSPHPPLIIPDIGGDRLREVAQTVAGMREMAKDLLASEPELIVFLTPHGNVFSDCINSLGFPNLYGDFSRFGHKKLKFNRPNNLTFIKEIEKMAINRDLSFIIIDEKITANNRLNVELDHGILVPLYYLQEAGLKKETSIIPISIGLLSSLTLYEFGSIINEVAEKLGIKVAILASGDMSHRLIDDGPYSFHPDGAKFDNFIKTALVNQDVADIVNISPVLRENAGECAYPSIVIMLGCLDGYNFTSKIYSYEGPLGVGYLTAGFKKGDKAPSFLNTYKAELAEEIKNQKEKESPPVKWARLVLENYVTNGVKPNITEELQELKKEKGAAFVTLKKHGELRGCIGTILPVHDSLADELANNAINAGTSDPRFAPVTIKELSELSYSVDILSAPEKCNQADLNPDEYGVIVTRGKRRGLLLPMLEGVDTVEEQLAIALNKAGIAPNEDYEIERFKVVRYY